MKEETKEIYDLVTHAVHILEEMDSLQTDIREYDRHSSYVLTSKSEDKLNEVLLYDMDEAIKEMRFIILHLTQAMTYNEEGENNDTEEKSGDEAFPGKYWTGDDAESHTEPV